jgi:Family of unknown function (DUF6082)
LKALDDPDLLACWGSSLQGDFKRDRQHSYNNLIVTFWTSMFEIGMLTDDVIRHLAADMFQTVPGRRYWSVAGRFRTALSSGRQGRFVEIMHEEYEKAAAIPVVDSLKTKTLPPTQSHNGSTLGALALGLVGGALLGTGLNAIRRGYKPR